MSIKRLELYLDESGDFNEGKENRPLSEEPSMVGGLLCESGWMTQQRLLDSFGGKRVHTCGGYRQYYLSLLQNAINDGCRFVLFENTEKIRVIDSNITYINIISEGLVRLFRDLSIEYPDGVHIKVVIAQRNMKLYGYEKRVREKVIMALGRKNLGGVEYELLISDARKDVRLNYPDIICNTWYTKERDITKNGRKVPKFTPEARAIIDRIYDPQWIYSVFEDITITILDQLLEERHYGEAMFRMCTLPQKKGFKKIQRVIIKGIETSDSYEQDTWFTQMSLLIGQYNRLCNYKDGIKIAENYIRLFLNAFFSMEHLRKQATFWLFDTNYYLLTMYDHVGNVSKCREHLHICTDNLDVINRTWEHIDYYFGFRIRELNVLIGQFAFQEVLQRAKELEKIFIEARNLFRMIKSNDDVSQDVRSELLGKVYGVQLEAMINLLHKQPELYDEAIELSDKALAEFIDSRDISRQYQWRCLLMVEARNPKEAYRMLLKAAEIDEDNQAVENLLSKIYDMRKGTYDFLLWHFSNVMLLFKETGYPLGDQMYQMINENAHFLQDVQDEDKDGHPWNVVLWNIARCARLNGEYALFKQLYRKAMQITRKNKANVTMMTFAISISAERWLWCRENRGSDIVGAKAEFESVCKEVKNAGLTKEMELSFHILDWDNKKAMTDEVLADIANAYLR